MDTRAHGLTCPKMQMSATILTVLLFPPMLGPVTTKASPLLDSDVHTARYQ